MAIRIGNATLEWLVLGAVFIALLALGGMLAWGFAAAFTLLVLAFWLWATLRCLGNASGFSNGQSDNPYLAEMPTLQIGSRLLAAAIPAFALYLIFQLLPLPASWVGVLSPSRLALAQQINQALEQAPPRWLTLAIDSGATRHAMLEVLAAFFAFIMGLHLGAEKQRARGLMRGLIALALAEALYGLAENLSGHGYVLWYKGLGSISGTFYNRNHFGAFMAMFVPASLGWFLFRAAEPQLDRWSGRYREPEFWEVISSRRGLGMLTPAILVVSVFQTASRGSFLSMVIGVALFFALSARGRLSRTLGWLAATAGVVLLLYAIGSDYQSVLNRLDQMTGADHIEGRLIIWRDSLGILRDYPLFGIGLGNYGGAFKHYSSMNTMVFPRYAHNEWLEALLTQGWVGFAPFALMFLALGRVLVRSVRQAIGRDRLWKMGVLSGLSGLAIHSFTEFNFHLPAIAITAALMMGLLLAHRPAHPRHHGSSIS